MIGLKHYAIALARTPHGKEIIKVRASTKIPLLGDFCLISNGLPLGVLIKCYESIIYHLFCPILDIDFKCAGKAFLRKG